jgi:protease-4
VYALKPNIAGLAATTGLGRDVVTRGRFADANTPFKPLEGEAYQMFIDASGEIYLDFVGKVARSRKMSAAAVDSVAGGRVWTGRQALQRGLADKEGGLFDAVKAARKLAGMDMKKQPRLLLYPERRTWLQMLLAGDTGALAGVLGRTAVRGIVRESLPAFSGTAMLRMYDMMARSGQVWMVAAMPCEITVR